MGSRPFPAKYVGQCPECDEWWKEEEAIKYDDDGQLIHAVCPHISGILRSWDTNTCPECNLQLPRSGECDGCN